MILVVCRAVGLSCCLKFNQLSFSSRCTVSCNRRAMPPYRQRFIYKKTTRKTIDEKRERERDDFIRNGEKKMR